MPFDKTNDSVKPLFILAKEGIGTERLSTGDDVFVFHRPEILGSDVRFKMGKLRIPHDDEVLTHFDIESTWPSFKAE